ncbi:uncharacterized protein [Parasteatoda tepidariorum]|uniref:uncharacterized protein isoform X2 n=1 Tax=Parasteatoda tepidariorum TaxID=114398 RepID=UPI0039BD4E16
MRHHILPFFFILILVLCSVEAGNESANNEPGSIANIKYQSATNTNAVGYSSTTDNVPRFNRQLDSDVESRFHISPNTIIRTSESRVLGARYINETVLPSNHDCLTWCLETPNCNLAVYEEKDAQSCYMFNCGGPSESLCKFTSHSFFISSVLKITQHSYDLSQWGNQVKHEQELAKLRSEEISSSTTAAPKSVLLSSVAPQNLKMAPNPANLCHHYQFKCLNSSECIAIYNVCDGIPQCPDGSDESIELKCHEKGDSDGLGSPFVHKHSQFVAANDPHVQSLNRWSNDYDQYPSHSAAMDQQYAPYEGNNYQRIDDQYASNQLSPDYDTVKGYNNYRQEDIPYWSNQDTSFPVDEYPQPAIHNLNKQSNYPDKDSIYAQQLARTADQYPEIKHHIMHKPPDPAPETSQQNRASENEGYKPHRVALERQQPYLTYDDVLQKQLYPEMKPKSYPTRNMEDSVYNSDDLIRASLVNQIPMEMDHSYQYKSKHSGESSMPHESEKSKNSHESEKGKELAKDSLIIVKPTSPPKSVQRTVLDFKMSVTELYQSSRIHSQEANSAILALVVGLTITFLLFVFLVCRVKTIRKRMSKKGRALAHDADYLVNGMYL